MNRETLTWSPVVLLTGKETSHAVWRALVYSRLAAEGGPLAESDREAAARNFAIARGEGVP